MVLENEIHIPGKLTLSAVSSCVNIPRKLQAQ